MVQSEWRESRQEETERKQVVQVAQQEGAGRERTID